MNTIYKWGAVAAVMLLSACTKNFEELNTNPEVSPGTNPELLITASEKTLVDRDFDWFYDNYQYLMRWMQFVVAAPSSTTSGLFSPTNVNDLYSALYNQVGRNLTEINAMISKMPAETKEKYQQVAAIAQVVKVYAAWRVADANGSIPYTEAWKARDSALFTPRYDNQESLFATWDAELKSAIDILGKGLGNQVAYGAADIFYSGDVAKWGKAANVLRLKIAMRLLKRAPEKMSAVAKEVMASPAGIFTGNEDEWKFVSGSQNFARGGNWSPDNNPFVPARNLIDFMYDNADPRLRIFFKKNAFSQAATDSIKKGGGLPADAVYNPRQYVGLPSSPDAKGNAAYSRLFSNVKRYSLKIGGKTISAEFDTLSKVQLRLFDMNQEGNLSGQYTQPILTYAEMCFMLSELSLRGIIGEDAQGWYEKGVAASVKAYDKIGSLATLTDYKAVEDAEIQTYLSGAKIAFTGSNDEKLEKIGVQTVLNHFKSPWEAWGAWKRLGYPKEGGILPREPFVSNGVKVQIPRRWALPLPSQANNANYLQAIGDMKKTGEYGNDVNVLTGRVWWDKQ